MAARGNQSGIEAGKAYVTASLNDGPLVRGLKGMKSRIGAVTRGLVSTLSVGIGAGIGSTLAHTGISKALEAINETAQIDKIAKAFGVAADEASGLFGVFKNAGASNVRENVESLVTLSGRINDVLTGTGEESKKLFAGLSVSAQELSQLPITEQFFRLHEAIMRLPDPIDRINRLMLAFGEDGGKTLIGTLSKSTEELRKQAAELQITQQQAENASEAQEAMTRAGAAMTQVWTKIAISVAPVIEKIAGGLTEKVMPAISGTVSKLMSLDDGFKSLEASALGPWQNFVTTVAANVTSLESKINKLRASFIRFQVDNPGIFDLDPLKLQAPGEAERRALQLANELEGRSARLADQAQIIRAARNPTGINPDGTLVNKEAVSPVEAPRPKTPENRAAIAEVVKQVNAVATVAANHSSAISSQGTFSGRAAGLLGVAENNPLVKLGNEQVSLLQDIKANTEEGGIVFE